MSVRMPRTGSQCGRLLRELVAAYPDWLDDPYGRVPSVVHSRISALRDKGFLIEQRRFGRGDHRYRLLMLPVEFGGCEIEASGQLRMAC